MRDFFKSELETLYAKTQLRQYETLSAMTDAKGNSDGKRQVSIMLDTCAIVCEQYPYIPDEDKKKIVQAEMLKDPEFKGFNGQILHKWFSSKKDVYWAQYQSQVEKQTQTTPVPFEALPEALQKEIEAFKAKLLEGGGMKAVPSVTQAEIDAIKREDEISQEGQKSAAIEYRQKSAEIYTRKMEVIKARGLDKVDLRDLKMFMIEDQTIHARNREEAEEIWLEIYGG